jgi:hypothetical protein
MRLVIDELDHMRSMVERLLLLGRSLERDFLEVESLGLRSFVADEVEAGLVPAPRHRALPPVPHLVLQVDVVRSGTGSPHRNRPGCRLPAGGVWNVAARPQLRSSADPRGWPFGPRLPPWIP